MTADRCIYVGNINPKITTDILYELFLQAGPLEDVTVKDTFAFVTFEDEESVPYACSLFEGITLYGTELKIRPRQNSKFQDLKIRSVPPSAYQYSRPRIDPSYSAPPYRSHFNGSTDYVHHTSHRRDPFSSFTPPAGNRHLVHEMGYNYYSRYEHNQHPSPSYDLLPYGWQHGPPAFIENRPSERRRSDEYSRHMGSTPTVIRRERSPYSRHSSSRPESSYNHRYG